jgi:hypothetical protein
MQEFNDALLRACKRYPSLRVYDWAGEVKNGWFNSEGIHFTSAGYRQRARASPRRWHAPIHAASRPPLTASCIPSDRTGFRIR